ncbi:hypothetical protein [Streptomyces rubrogriseus]|uniref:hypothetical protein n=1 Tax=Streptomyces rubrogriseus TaxID=194673 RepID=UPI003663D4AD
MTTTTAVTLPQERQHTAYSSRRIWVRHGIAHLKNRRALTRPPKPAPVKERQVAFSFTKNLLANADSADGFAALFRALYMTLDERQISYLQGTLQLVMQADAAEEIQQRLEELGINGTFKEI